MQPLASTACLVKRVGVRAEVNDHKPSAVLGRHRQHGFAECCRKAREQGDAHASGVGMLQEYRPAASGGDNGARRRDLESTGVAAEQQLDSEGQQDDALQLEPSQHDFRAKVQWALESLRRLPRMEWGGVTIARCACPFLCC